MSARENRDVPRPTLTLAGLTALLTLAPALAAPASPAEVVRAMQDAIRSGDATTYLALVDLRDPLFATEHRRLVQDWTARPPNDLRLTLRDLRQDSNRATAQVQWSWRTAAGDSRDVTLPSLFTKTNGTWRYAGETFAVSLAGGRVLAQDGQQDVARAVAAEIDDLVGLVERTLGYRPAQAPVLKLYGSGAALSASVRLSMQPVGGWNEPGEAIKLATPRWPQSRGTVAHELTHAAVFSRFGEGQIRIPWWLHEGLAQFVASATWTDEARVSYLRRSVDWRSRNQLVAWPELADFEKVPEDRWAHVYGQGYALVRFVVERHGMPRLTAFMELLANGQDPNTAATRTLGVGFDTLDQQWRAWLAERATAAR